MATDSTLYNIVLLSCAYWLFIPLWYKVLFLISYGLKMGLKWVWWVFAQYCYISIK